MLNNNIIVLHIATTNGWMENCFFIQQHGKLDSFTFTAKLLYYNLS